MLKPEIRKIVTFEEETFIEGYKSADTPPTSVCRCSRDYQSMGGTLCRRSKA